MENLEDVLNNRQMNLTILTTAHYDLQQFIIQWWKVEQQLYRWSLSSFTQTRKGAIALGWKE